MIPNSFAAGRKLVLAGVNVALIFLLACPPAVPANTVRPPCELGSHDNSPTDSTGARLLLEQQGQMLRVQGVFTNEDTAAGSLHYELAVQRTGGAGTSQSTQSGQFETAPGQTDTLSTVRLNVQPGDRMELHLTIRRDDTLVDEVRQQHTF